MRARTSTHAHARRLHLQRTLTFIVFHIESVGAMADLRGLDSAGAAPLKFYGSYGVRTCLSPYTIKPFVEESERLPGFKQLQIAGETL